jgi:hypothetical protein
MTTTGVIVANHRDFWTEKLTVVALVAQATVEAAFSFSNGQTSTNLEIDFCKRLEAFLTQEAGLGHHGRELEIISIEVMVANDLLVALRSWTTHIRF